MKTIIIFLLLLISVSEASSIHHFSVVSKPQMYYSRHVSFYLFIFFLILFYFFSCGILNFKLYSYFWLPCSLLVIQSCTECSPPMLLPNSCSAAAHQRIHQGCPPHVCPECGGAGKQPSFHKHLHETCLHFSRRIGYRCDISTYCMWLFN